MTTRMPICALIAAMLAAAISLAIVAVGAASATTYSNTQPITLACHQGSCSAKCTFELSKLNVDTNKNGVAVVHAGARATCNGSHASGDADFRIRVTNDVAGHPGLLHAALAGSQSSPGNGYWNRTGGHCRPGWHWYQPIQGNFSVEAWDWRFGFKFTYATVRNNHDAQAAPAVRLNGVRTPSGAITCRTY